MLFAPIAFHIAKMFLLEVMVRLCYSLELAAAVDTFQDVRHFVMFSGVANGGILFVAAQALDRSILALKNVFIHLLLNFFI